MKQKRSAVLNFPFRNDAVLSVDDPHCPGSEALDICRFGDEDSIAYPVIAVMHLPEVIFPTCWVGRVVGARS